MRVHLVIDFMHIFYKYFFQLQAGKLRELSNESEELESLNGDCTMVYYPLKDIEGLRKKAEGNGNDVTLSICFDNKSKRKDTDVTGAVEYKANRGHKLGEKEFDSIRVIKEQLRKIGYNVYDIEGFEADDIVADLVEKYKDSFDYTVVITNDKDVLASVCDNVGAMRFKSYKGYQQVTKENFAEYLSAEFKCDIRYNNLRLFLSSVGDKADNIAGIHKFGPKAFDKLVGSLDSLVDWETATTEEMIEKSKSFLDDVQYKQLVDSYILVKNYSIDSLDKPVKNDSSETRKRVYEQLIMPSLIG